MSVKLAIIALGFGLATILRATSQVGAEEQPQGHGHMAAPAPSGAAMALQAQGQTVTFGVTSLNGSGISGSVVLTPLTGDRVEAAVALAGAGVGPRPIHVHEGACADLNPVPEIPLTTVENGTSTTVVDASLQQLTSTPHAIFIHKSPQEIPVFVACADLMVAKTVATVPSAGEDSPDVGMAAGLIGFGGALAIAGCMLRRRAHRARALGPS